MVYILRFFSSKCSLFHNSNVFDSCIIHILYTGVLKLKNNSGAKRLKFIKISHSLLMKILIFSTCNAILCLCGHFKIITCLWLFRLWYLEQKFPINMWINTNLKSYHLILIIFTEGWLYYVIRKQIPFTSKRKGWLNS